MGNNILVIGTGSIANRHVENILKIDKSSTIDVLSRDYHRSNIFCKKFKKSHNENDRWWYNRSICYTNKISDV